MSHFLKEIISGENIELLIDTRIFPKDIILKAAYNFLDKGYFFFRFDEARNIILEIHKKQGSTIDPKILVLEYSDELLDVFLRDKLEKDNRVIREAIVTKSLQGPIDIENYVSYDSDHKQSQKNEIDFDKDIDDILREIENDPDLQIDEGEIEKILREIEQEAAIEQIVKPELKINPDNIALIKQSFKSKK